MGWGVTATMYLHNSMQSVVISYFYFLNYKLFLKLRQNIVFMVHILFGTFFLNYFQTVCVIFILKVGIMKRRATLVQAVEPYRL
jgi:hypothetical protein